MKVVLSVPEKLEKVKCVQQLITSSLQRQMCPMLVSGKFICVLFQITGIFDGEKKLFTMQRELPIQIQTMILL